MYISLSINEKEVLNQADEIIADRLEELNRKSRYCFTPTEIGRQFGVKGNDLNSFLKDRGIIFKKQGCYHLTKKFQNQGLTAYHYGLGVGRDGYPKLKTKLVWTEAGRQFINDMLRG